MNTNSSARLGGRGSPLTGVFPPMVTPVSGHDKLDSTGLERLIEHLVEGGASGLFILGTTGEGTCLSRRLRREVIEQTCRQAAHRVPVLVCVVDTAFEESVLLARYAAEQGAHSVVTAAPFALAQGQQRDLRAYLEHLAAAVPLPLFLYNMPPLTKTHFDRETIRWAMDQPQIAGLKDSSGDLDYFRQVCAWLPTRPDWTLLSGPEELLAETVAMGGHGGIPGGANVFPRLYAALYEAAREEDAARTKALHSAVMQVSQRLYHLDGGAPGVIKGIKCALSCLGICSGVMSEPFQQFGETTKEQVQEALDELQPLIQDALQTQATLAN